MDNRAARRDVHLYDANDRSKKLGGLILSNGMTKASLYAMVEILLIFRTPFSIQTDETSTVSKDDSPLAPGLFSVNDEPFFTRTISLGSSIRHQGFKNRVPARDGGCVIMKIKPPVDYWWGFQACHIFPLAYGDYWTKQRFSRLITNVSDGSDAINSVQNGLMLRNDLHSLFDSYILSINPDDDFKVVDFGANVMGVGGTYLSEDFITNPDRPSKELLRWHYRQAVLANVRGVGEPLFENDYPPGPDMVGDILRGPKGSERMEFELLNRLAMHVDLA